MNDKNPTGDAPPTQLVEGRHGVEELEVERAGMTDIEKVERVYR